MVTVAGFSSPALLLPRDAPLAPGAALLVFVDATFTAGVLAASSSEDPECNLVATVLLLMSGKPALGTNCLTERLCKGNCKYSLTHKQQKMMLHTQCACLQ